ncbi:hypothetical protein WDU94_005712 [Cyamophila willieti]
MCISVFILAVLLVNSICIVKAQEEDNEKVKNETITPENLEKLKLLERRKKMSNVIVYGWPERENEIIMDTVEAIGHKLGILKPLSMVRTAFRANKPSNRIPRPILIRLANNSVKGKWIILYRKSKLWKKQFYIEEHLSKAIQLLSSQTRVWVKSKNYTHTWTWNSRVFYRKSEDDSKRYRVLNMRHLVRLNSNEKLSEIVDISPSSPANKR